MFLNVLYISQGNRELIVPGLLIGAEKARIKHSLEAQPYPENNS